MPDDEKPKEEEVVNFTSPKFILELVKQGQVFFILLLILYGAWVSIPRAWYEVTNFFQTTQAKYEVLAAKQDAKLDQTATTFSASIEKLVNEMKAGNEAMEKLAEAEEQENIRAEAERRARPNANP